MKNFFILVNFVLLLTACDGNEKSISPANTNPAPKVEVETNLQHQNDSPVVSSHDQHNPIKAVPENDADTMATQVPMPPKSQETSNVIPTVTDENDTLKSKEKKINPTVNKEKKPKSNDKFKKSTASRKKESGNAEGLSEEERRVGAQQPLSMDNINHLKSQCRYPFMSDKEMKIYRCFPVKVKQ